MIFDRWFPESNDHLPLTWWKQRPVYLSAIIALVGVASMVAYAVLGHSLAANFVFTFDAAFRHLRLWTPLTYVLVNAPSLWVIFCCYLLWNFGEAVERHLGRRSFVRLLVVLLLVPPMTATLFGLAGLEGFGASGITQLEFAVFIAFATLYPHAKISLILFTLDVWILAAVIVGLNALGSLTERDWPSLLHLASNVVPAYAFVRHAQGLWQLPRFPKVVIASSPKPRSTKSAARKAPSVDEILDKISRDGMQSLTPEERLILDKASAEMKRRAG